jgi:hypothetical protein
MMPTDNDTTMEFITRFPSDPANQTIPEDAAVAILKCLSGLTLVKPLALSPFPKTKEVLHISKTA